MLEDISENKIQFDFTPEERELERELANKARREINKRNIPEMEKMEMKDMLFNSLLTYENGYRIYQKRTAIKNSSLLN